MGKGRFGIGRWIVARGTQQNVALGKDGLKNKQVYFFSDHDGPDSWTMYGGVM
jgi:hypothetical protein